MCDCPWPGPHYGSAFEFENELPSMGGVLKDEWKTGPNHVALAHPGTIRMRFMTACKYPASELGVVAIST